MSPVINLLNPNNAPNTVYHWEVFGNCGLLDGSGNTIPSFLTANNATTQTSSINVWPVVSYPQVQGSCIGDTIDFNITVKPTPTVVLNPYLQDSICSGEFTDQINFASTVNGTIFHQYK